jgi:predicted RecA/RadA family phage recombinase
MSKNQIFQHSETMSLPVPAGRASGQAVAVGNITGVLQTDRAADEDNLHGNPIGNATVAIEGTFELAIADAGALAVGVAVYVAADGTVNTTTTNKLLGYLVSAKAAGAGAVARVLLSGGHASQA